MVPESQPPHRHVEHYVQGTSTVFGLQVCRRRIGLLGNEGLACADRIERCLDSARGTTIEGGSPAVQIVVGICKANIGMAPPGLLPPFRFQTSEVPQFVKEMVDGLEVDDMKMTLGKGVFE